MAVVINFPAAGGGGSSGGSSSFASLTGVPSDNSALNSALLSKVGTPVSWVAATNTPTITSGIAPSGGVTAYTVTDSSIVVLGTPIDGVTAVRPGDQMIWSVSLSKWVRYAGTPITIQISGATTLNDAHNDCLLVNSGSPAITINTGLMAGFGCQLINNWSPTGSATFSNDQRITGNSSGPSTIEQTTTDVYALIGSKT